MRAAGTVIPAIAALTGDHPPGEKGDDEKGEEDFERPERDLGCPSGEKGDAGATAQPRETIARCDAIRDAPSGRDAG